MADSEKGNSSSGKDKGKVSKLDDDISKDFLSSWKSMSITGGDDMDFNFEPVTKGNKKAFDFDKLDMDFSLDSNFGKMSSFKMDMPDLDFSNSPKKCTKSKETSKLESGKGRLSSTNSDFSFSFDFNGMDDLSLDAPSNKGGKSPGREKSKSSKEVCPSKEMECEDLPTQVDNDEGKTTENTTGKTPPISENATISISENLIDIKKNFDASLGDFSSTSSIEVDTLQTEETQICPEKTPTSSLLKSASVTAPVESEDAKKSPSMEKMPPVKGIDEEVQTGRDDKVQSEKGGSKQSYTEPKVKDLSANYLLVKTPTVSTISDEFENSSLNEGQNDISEACTLNGQLLGADGEKMKPDNPSPECYTDKMNVDYGENKTLVDGNASAGKLTSDSMNPSVTNASEVLPSETRYKVETQRSASKVFASPFGSGSTLAKPTLLAYRVRGSYSPKFPRVDNTKQGVMANLSVMEKKDKGSTHPSATEDRKYIQSSSTKEMVNPDSVTKSSEKNAVVDTLSSREGKNDMKQKNHGATSIDMVSQDRQAMKDEHFVPGNEKKIEDAKSSSLAVPLHPLSPQESKFGKQISTKFKEKMPGILSTQKSSSNEMNKLPSLTIGKKLSGFPGSKSSVNVAITKHSASPVGENAKSMGTLGNRFQYNPRSSPSLKRKPSEADDEGPRNPHPLKRLSPGDCRVPKGLSPGKAKEEVQTKGSPVDGRAKNVTFDHSAAKFDFHLERSMAEFTLTSVLESDENVEKAEACAKELDDICNMLKKKHEEAKELLVRALVNHNNLLMLNHPIYEDKLHAVQGFADKLMSKQLKAGV